MVESVIWRCCDVDLAMGDEIVVEIDDKSYGGEGGGDNSLYINWGSERIRVGALAFNWKYKIELELAVRVTGHGGLLW